MSYAIISDIALVLIGVLAYWQYYTSLGGQIKKLKKALKEEIAKKEDFEAKYVKVTEIDGEKIEGLLREIDELRKEKESEVRIRLGAEKQVELALKKVDEIEKRMKDWRLVQEAAMNDSQHAIEEVGEDIYHKLSDSYKAEVEENKNLMNKISQNISELFSKKKSTSNLTESKNTPAPKDQDIEEEVAKIIKEEPVVKKEKEQEREQEVPKAKAQEEKAPGGEDQTKRLVSDYVDLAKASGHVSGKNYFISDDLDEKKAKLLLCEFAFITSKKAYIMDFKACHYVAEYHQNVGDEAVAKEALKKRFEKYLSYLGNKKYELAVSKVINSCGSKFEKSILHAVVPKKSDLAILEEGGYLKMAEKFNINIIDFDNASNIIL